MLEEAMAQPGVNIAPMTSSSNTLGSRFMDGFAILLDRLQQVRVVNGSLADQINLAFQYHLQIILQPDPAPVKPGQQWRLVLHQEIDVAPERIEIHCTGSGAEHLQAFNPVPTADGRDILQFFFNQAVHLSIPSRCPEYNDWRVVWQ